MTFLVTCKSVVGSVVRLGLIHFVCYKCSPSRLMKFNVLVVQQHLCYRSLVFVCTRNASETLSRTVYKHMVKARVNVNEPVIHENRELHCPPGGKD